MRGKDRIQDLLTRPDRGVGSTSGITGVLAGLFRQMLSDLNITPMRWRHLMDEYVQIESVHHNKDNRRDRTSIRGNLNKEFIRTRMTWKVFCRAMMLLKLRRFGIIIVAEHENGRKTVHSKIVDFNTASESAPEDSDESLKTMIEDIQMGNIQKYKQPTNPAAQPATVQPPKQGV